jgi:uncharacterized membrane protein
MDTATLLYIALAGIAALLLALFQYLYKDNRSLRNKVFAVLRFITLFAVLLLLINPKFEQTRLYNERPNLAVVVDNSQSVAHLEQDENVLGLINTLRQNPTLNNNFKVDYYAFGKDINVLDTLGFNEKQTNITSVFNGLSQISSTKVTPAILITDGNQTYGSDYEFVSKQYDHPIFPIILGDTTTYSDLRIQQLNVNKYAYLKNRFPVEIIVVYNGSEAVRSQLVVRKGNSVVHTQNLNFSDSQNSQMINITLAANTVGVNSYVATIVPLEDERNIINNSKPFAVEVIDQKTSVAIVTDMIHPDLGALKKSIESNEQRSVSILSPNDYLENQDAYQLAILYQPNNSFRTVFEALEATGGNKFIVTGTETQWTFLNSIQDHYSQDITSQVENFQAGINTNYTTFILDDLDFDSFPPLENEFGSIAFKTNVEPILYKRTRNTLLEDPLLVTFEDSGRREAALFGEHIWKWRAQSYLNTQSFELFDNFIGKLIQYLASNKIRSRLSLNYESFYSGISDVRMRAQYFNRNYEFDDKASLEIDLKDVDNGEITQLPFILKNNSYEVDLGGLMPGEYDFTVRANNREVVQSGRFKILDYNVEQQFLNANVTKLQQVAKHSGGSDYFIENTTSLIDDLISDSRFAIIQKSSKNVVPLIDFKYLLALIVLSLAMEWFLRKYNGLI